MPLLAWGCLGVSPHELHEVARERKVLASLLMLLSNPAMDGWMGCFLTSLSPAEIA